MQDHIYEGQFKDNVYHGWGRLIDNTGVYEGYWENGVRHGQGKFINAENDAECKEGNWENGFL